MKWNESLLGAVKKADQGAAKNTWRKVRWELMLELVMIAQADPVVLVEDSEERLNKFLGFCVETVLKEIKLKSKEVFTFLILIKHDKIKDAVAEYSNKVAEISNVSLQKNARDLKNLIVKKLKGAEDFSQKWLDYSGEKN